jgi:hypothetical protein
VKAGLAQARSDPYILRRVRPARLWQLLQGQDWRRSLMSFLSLRISRRPKPGLTSSATTNFKATETRIDKFCDDQCTATLETLNQTNDETFSAYMIGKTRA